MKVILLKKIKGVGEAGQVKEVSAGYARNFLLPNNYAQPATDEAIKQVHESETRLEAKAERELKQAQKLVSRLDGQEIEIVALASPSGKLFAAIKATDITQAINAKYGTAITPRAINLAQPIKEVGELRVAIDFDHGLEATVLVCVITKNKS